MTPEQQERLEGMMENLLCQMVALRAQLHTHIALQRAEHLLERELKNKPDMTPEQIAARSAQLLAEAEAWCETHFQQTYVASRQHSQAWKLPPHTSGSN